MAFESLPNEIFLDIFDYFDGSDLIYAFDALNSRFNSFLYQEYRRFRFDFRSISKVQFDQICQQHLPRIADQVIALSFASLNDIPEQFPLFYSYISSFNSFTHLQSLSLPCSEKHETTMTLVDKRCYHLSSENSEWFFKNFDNNHNHFQSIIESIWSLSKLVHCKMGVLSLAKVLPTRTSMSIECLSWDEGAISCNQLVQLIQHTPCVKHLSISLEDREKDYIPILFSTLITFKLRIYYVAQYQKIILLLQNMPNLYSLEINSTFQAFYGHQLEDLITNYLPKLSKFRLKMMMGATCAHNVLRKAISCVDSFRSSFWIETHRWFVRCFSLHAMIHICTVPNTFADSSDSLPYLFYSTDPHDHLQSFDYDTTNTYHHRFFNNLPFPHLPFTNIESLMVRRPNHDRCWSVVTNLPQLHSLEINAKSDISQTDLQVLFDQAPNLRRLKFRATGSSSFEVLLLFKNVQTVFRRLDLEHDQPFFTPNELIEFACSSLVRQCEVLSITVWNEEGILTLITCMNKLRILEVTCYDIRCANHTKAETTEERVSARDELIQWLQEHLPSTCLITKSEKSLKCIRIWL